MRAEIPQFHQFGISGAEAFDIISRLAYFRCMEPGKNDAIKTYLREIGAKGGRKSRRRLEPVEARSMVAVREARRAFRNFKAQCFWSFDPDWSIHREQLPLVIDTLREEGDARAFAVARRLYRLAKG